MATLSGLFTAPKPHLRNFVLENRKKIRQMSSKSIRSDVTQSSVGSKSIKSLAQSSKRSPGPPPQDGDQYPVMRTRLFIQCRNQGSQTEDESSLSGSFQHLSVHSPLEVEDSKETVNRQLKDSKTPNVVFEENDCFKSQNNQLANSSSGRCDTNHQTTTDTLSDCTKVNSTACQTKSEKTTTRSQSVTSRKGLPRRHYYKTSKKEPHVEVDPDCPAGHVAITEFERLEMLENLNSGYEDRIQDLNKLPVGADTLRIRTRRIELEKQLKQIEEGIKLFSKPKVYVKSEG